MNDLDLASPGFDSRWLAVDLKGTPIAKGSELKLGSLSVPGFRSYLIGEAMKQVQAGVRELHFGETNGAIYFDDWTLGLREQSGYFHWLAEKFSGLSASDWNVRFGPLGERVRVGSFPQRAELMSASASDIAKFFSTFGKAGSWTGNTESGEVGFLSEKYAKNLSEFIKEIRDQLKSAGREDVLVSVLGVAPWFERLESKADFVVTSPPDERWGLPWASDPNFVFETHRSRIVDELRKDVRMVFPAPLVLAIDHPHPWSEFVQLSDERQASLWRIWKGVADEVGGLLLLRSYSQERNKLGPKALAEIQALCNTQHGASVSPPSDSRE